MRFLLLFMLISASALGQYSAIEGKVSHRGTTLLSGVHLILKNTSLSAVSDGDGKFVFKNVPLGSYELIASHVGFETLSQNIQVTKQPLQMAVTMNERIGQLDELQVKAEKVSSVQEAKPISIKSVDVKEVIGQNMLVTDIVDRLSGVRIRRSGSVGDKSDITINGLRGSAVRVYLDGLPMELVYPNFDVSNLPLANIKRIDVYKGVLPVDVGTDAMGGAINIVSEQKSYNTLRASYLGGSFHTHMTDLHVGLANKKNYFLNVTGALNLSENDYKMKAFVFEKNRTETVKRFNDGYRMLYGGVNFGVHSKRWADELRISLNASEGFKELQNGARITNVAFGQVLYMASNYTANVKYEKTAFNEKVRFSNLLNYSYEKLNYRDTTGNVYSWSGAVLGRDALGEYFLGWNDNFTNAMVNRTTLTYQPSVRNTFTLSNLFAKQRRTGENFLEDDGELTDYLDYPQYLTKNITGVQYEGRVGNHLTVSAAAKYYHFDLKGVENQSFLPMRVRDSFFGYNGGVKYDFTENLHVKASYERGFLIPFFEQFVGNGANILRNTDLIPESSDNINLSAGYHKRFDDNLAIAANTNGFLREQYDVIFIGNTIFTRYENSDQVHTLGIEGDFSISFQKNWQLKVNYTQLGKKFSKMKDARNQYLVGTTFPNNPTSFGNMELEWKKVGLIRTGDTFRAYVFYNRIGTFNHMLIGQKDTKGSRPDLFVPEQNRFDAGVSYKMAKWNTMVALNAINLFNAELYDNFSIPRAGRNYNLKIIYEINHF